MKVCLLFCVLCLVATIGYSLLLDYSDPIPGPPGDSGPIGFPGQQGNAGPPGEHGRAADCKDVIDPINQDLETLQKSTTKLELVINFDFVRRVGQKYFVSNKERGSFSRAAEFCSQRGLELALPQNEDENNSLTEVFGDDPKTVWINFNNKKAEGAVNMRTRPPTFTKWGEGQPDQSVQESGCTTLSENSIWRVTGDCFLNAYIICQL